MDFVGNAPRCFDDVEDDEEDAELLKAASEADATVRNEAGPVVDDFEGSTMTRGPRPLPERRRRVHGEGRQGLRHGAR